MEAVKKEEVTYFTQHFVTKCVGRKYTVHEDTRAVLNRDPRQITDEDCIYFQFWDLELFELNGIIYPLNKRKINFSPNIILKELRSSIFFKNPDVYDKLEANSLSMDEAIALYEKEKAEQLRLFPW